MFDLNLFNFILQIFAILYPNFLLLYHIFRLKVVACLYRNGKIFVRQRLRMIMTGKLLLFSPNIVTIALKGKILLWKEPKWTTEEKMRKRL